MTLGNKLPPIHPGEILRELFLEPLGMSPYALARNLHIPRTRIERLVAEKVGISADTALRFAKYFNTTPHLWLNMQASYDLKIQAAAIESELAGIEKLKQPDALEAV